MMLKKDPFSCAVPPRLASVGTPKVCRLQKICGVPKAIGTVLHVGEGVHVIARGVAKTTEVYTNPCGDIRHGDGIMGLFHSVCASSAMPHSTESGWGSR